MGANENTNTFAYFFGGESEHIYNEEWDFWYDQVNLVDELTFDIDPESGLYTSEGSDCQRGDFWCQHRGVPHRSPHA